MMMVRRMTVLKILLNITKYSQCAGKDFEPPDF